MMSGVAAVTVLTALLAQQPPSPYFGSVPAGTITAEPLKLTVLDAIQRALKANVGLLLQEETEKGAGATRLRALAEEARALMG